MSYVAFARLGMSGIGDLLADAGTAVYTSMVNALSGPYAVTGPPPLHLPMSVNGVERSAWDSRIVDQISWIRNHANGVDPGAPGHDALFAIMDANALDGRGPSQGKRVVPYTRSDIESAFTTGMAQAMTDMAANLMLRYDSLLHGQVVALFHAIYPGLATVPSDDVEWGYGQIKSGALTIATLEQHWRAEAEKFKQVTDAVPWYTNQDDMYAVWKSTGWDIHAAVAAIMTAHPQPSSGGGGGGGSGGGGGGGGGTGTGAGSPLTVAGIDMSFLRSPLVWIGIAMAGGLYYWLSVRKETLTAIPYLGPYIGKARRAVGMKKR